MLKINLTQLDNLREGDKFSIPSLKDFMRDMVVLRQSPCSVLVKGERRDSINDSWQGFRYALSGSTVVCYEGQVNLLSRQDGSVTALKEPKAVEADMPKKRRGRPAKNAKLEFPEEDWTINEAAEKNKCKSHDIANAIKSGKIKVKQVGVKKKTGKRGKPSKLYRLI